MTTESSTNRRTRASPLTNQTIKSNRTTKQHAVVNIELYSHVLRIQRNSYKINVVAPFVPTSVVIVTLLC